MWFPRQNYEKQIDCVVIVTCYKVKKCHVLGNWLVLSGAEKYFSRNLSEVSIRLNEHQQDLLIFSLWDTSRGPFQYNWDNWFNIFFVSSSISFLWLPSWRLFCESSLQYQNFSRHDAYSGPNLEGCTGGFQGHLLCLFKWI